MPTLPAERAFCEKEPVCGRAGIYAYVLFCSEGSLKGGVDIHLSRGNFGFRLPWGVQRVGSECPPYLAERAFCEKESVCRRVGIYAHVFCSEGSLKPHGQQVPILLPTVCFQAGTQPCGALFSSK